MQYNAFLYCALKILLSGYNSLSILTKHTQKKGCVWGEHEETFGGNGYVYYIDYAVCICPNSSNYTHSIYAGLCISVISQ